MSQVTDPVRSRHRRAVKFTSYKPEALRRAVSVTTGTQAFLDRVEGEEIKTMSDYTGQQVGIAPAGEELRDRWRTLYKAD